MLERATMLSLLKKNRRSSNILNGEKTVIHQFEETRLKLTNLDISKGGECSINKNLPESALNKLAETNEDNEDSDSRSHDSLSGVKQTQIIHDYDIDELVSDADTISIQSADSEFDCEVADDSNGRLDCLVLSLLKNSSQELEFNTEVLTNIGGASSTSNINSEQSLKKLAEKGTVSLKYKIDDLSAKLPAMIFYSGSLLSQSILSGSKKHFLLTNKAETLNANHPKKFSLRLVFQNLPPHKQADQSAASTIAVIVPNSQECKFVSRIMKKHLVLERSINEPKLIEDCANWKKGNTDEVFFHFDPAEQNHCELESKTRKFSPFVNLSLARFQGNLLVEPGMHFQINQRIGFMIAEIIKPKDITRRAQILQTLKSKMSVSAHCANHDLSKLTEFFVDLTQGREMTDQISAENLYKQFCLQHMANNESSDFIVISIVEYLPQYNIYRMCESAIVFEYEGQRTQFDKYFHLGSTAFSHFTIGHSLFNTMKKFEGQYINSLFNFFAPYDICFGFSQTSNCYYMTYIKSHEQRTQSAISSICNDEYPNVDFHPAISPLTSSNAHKDEGIWVSLNKLTSTLEVDDYAKPAKIPYESLLMFRNEIYFLDRRPFSLALK